MADWMDVLRSALRREAPTDRISGEKRKTGDKVDLSYLKKFLVRHWRKGVLAAGMMIAATLLSFPQPLITKALIDDVILAKRLDLLPWVVLALLVVKGLEMFLGTMQRYYFTRFEQIVSMDIQKDVLDHTLRLPKAFFDEKETGYLTARLSSDVQGVRWFFSSSMVSVVSSLISFVGGVVFIFILEWRLGIITVVLLPVLVLATRYFSKRMRTLSFQSMEQHANVSQRYQETLSAVTLVKAFTSEERESDRIMNEVRSSRRIELESTVLGSFANLVIGVVPDLARVLVMVAGAALVILGEWTIGSMLAFLSYLGYVYSPAMSLAYANIQFQTALAAHERITALMKVIPEEKEGSGQEAGRLAGGIAFENVTFSYDGSATVFEDFKFKIAPGEHVAIAGPSGVGKTSLISLVLCFYRPVKGKVLFDGMDAEGFNLKSLRQRIGYVAQSSFLLSGTISDNLAYGNPEASREEIEKAARLAGIEEFIKGLPEKYETVLGERGVNLSEGQRQRLSIARALVKDPDILIFDEATSALDQIVESSILEELPKQLLEKTLIFISHRPSTLKKADRVLLFRDKRLVADGRHADLLRENEYYRLLAGEPQGGHPQGG